MFCTSCKLISSCCCALCQKLLCPCMCFDRWHFFFPLSYLCIRLAISFAGLFFVPVQILCLCIHTSLLSSCARQLYRCLDPDLPSCFLGGCWPDQGYKMSLSTTFASNANILLSSARRTVTHFFGIINTSDIISTSG